MAVATPQLNVRAKIPQSAAPTCIIMLKQSSSSSVFNWSVNRPESLLLPHAPGLGSKDHMHRLPKSSTSRQDGIDFCWLEVGSHCTSSHSHPMVVITTQWIRSQDVHTLKYARADGPGAPIFPSLAMEVNFYVSNPSQKYPSLISYGGEILCPPPSHTHTKFPLHRRNSFLVIAHKSFVEFYERPWPANWKGQPSVLLHCRTCGELPYTVLQDWSAYLPIGKDVPPCIYMLHVEWYVLPCTAQSHSKVLVVGYDWNMIPFLTMQLSVATQLMF